MNEIEKILADALANELVNMYAFLSKKVEEGAYTWEDYKKIREKIREKMQIKAFSQFKIGGFRVDFYLEDEVDGIKVKCIVEIDGQDFHKTKEQRQYDYDRERYFLREGYKVIRFTGGNIYQHPEKCVNFILSMLKKECDKINRYIITGYTAGAAGMFCIDKNEQIKHFNRMCEIVSLLPEENIQAFFKYLILKDETYSNMFLYYSILKRMDDFNIMMKG